MLQCEFKLFRGSVTRTQKKYFLISTAA